MDVATILGLIGAMSLSVERVVEILKNMVPFLAEKHQDPKKERYRKTSLHLMSTAVGALIAYLAKEQIQPFAPNIFAAPESIGLMSCLMIGLLSSGSSSFWNQSLSIVEEIKKAKKLDVKNREAKIN